MSSLGDGYAVLIIVILIFFALLDISATARKQLKQSKDIEAALYRLIEITKQQGRDKT